MNDLAVAAKPRRSFVVDGPPFVLVAIVFVLLVTVWTGLGHPAKGMAVLAIGMIATLALDFREWRAVTRYDRSAAAGTFASLPARLRQADARRIEQNRWR